MKNTEEEDEGRVVFGVEIEVEVSLAWKMK
jgi:hypothetical protein